MTMMTMALYRVCISRPVWNRSVHSAKRSEGGGAEPRGDVAGRGLRAAVQRSSAAQAQRRPVRGGRRRRGHAGTPMPHHGHRR